MPMPNAGLIKLMEECGELVQAAAKQVAYPNATIHPDGSNLKKRLEEELADVFAAGEIVARKMGLNLDFIRSRRAEKYARFCKWYKEE